MADLKADTPKEAVKGVLREFLAHGNETLPRMAAEIARLRTELAEVRDDEFVPDEQPHAAPTTPPDVAALAREALGLSERASKGPWQQTQNGKFGVALWDADGHPLFRSIAGAEHSRVSSEQPAPQWQLDCDFARRARTLLPQLARAVLDREGEGTTAIHPREMCQCGAAYEEHDERSWVCGNFTPMASPSPVVASEQQVAEAWDGTKFASDSILTAPLGIAWRLLSPSEQSRLLAFARALLSGARALTAGAPAEEPVRSVREFDARLLPQEAARREHRKRHPACEALFCGQHDCGSQGMACYINWPVSPNVSPAQTQEPRDG